jgi:hypothetical protein
VEDEVKWGDVDGILDSMLDGRSRKPLYTLAAEQWNRKGGADYNAGVAGPVTEGTVQQGGSLCKPRNTKQRDRRRAQDPCQGWVGNARASLAGIQPSNVDVGLIHHARRRPGREMQALAVPQDRARGEAPLVGTGVRGGSRSRADLAGAAALGSDWLQTFGVDGKTKHPLEAI